MTNWITDSQDEQSFEELFRDADQVHVPVFQRSYVWKKAELDQLERDIRLIREDVESSQFLGAIVAYERPRIRSVVGRLRGLDVVDGQQRLLTLYIMVLAIAEQIAAYDKVIAVEIVQEFLLLPQRRGLEINTRIVPAFRDRTQFRVIWDRLTAPNVLATELAEDPPNPPTASGSADGPLLQQYQRIVRKLKEQLPRSVGERLPYLRSLLEIVTRRLTFVNLKLTDASVATKIFERLNYRGVKVEIVDLVRNEIFSRVEDASEALRIHNDTWQPFEGSFQNRAEGFFFPYCLLHDSNTKTSEIFTELRRIWEELSPADIVRHMEPYRGPYLAVDLGVNSYDPSTLGLRVDRLHRLRRPSAVYPFVMGVLHAYDLAELPEGVACTLLDILESFLIRRAIAGLEPTGLHAVFKSLWADIKSDPTPDQMIAKIKERPTIQWPTSQELETAISTRAIAKAKVCPYLLVEYDRAIPGDNPSHAPTIEHILPQFFQSDGPWAVDFAREQHKEMVDLWANLVPLSSPLNSSVQASAYSVKRPRYARESMFGTPRSVAEDFETWTPDTLRARSSVLATWAQERWRY